MAIYKRGRGVELGTTENKSRKWPERDSNQGLLDDESDALTTRPRCLLTLSHLTESCNLWRLLYLETMSRVDLCSISSSVHLYSPPTELR